MLQNRQSRFDPQRGQSFRSSLKRSDRLCAYSGSWSVVARGYFSRCKTVRAWSWPLTCPVPMFRMHRAMTPLTRALQSTDNSIISLPRFLMLCNRSSSYHVSGLQTVLDDCRYFRLRHDLQSHSDHQHADLRQVRSVGWQSEGLPADLAGQVPSRVRLLTSRLNPTPT